MDGIQSHPCIFLLLTTIEKSNGKGRKKQNKVGNAGREGVYLKGNGKKISFNLIEFRFGLLSDSYEKKEKTITYTPKL